MTALAILGYASILAAALFGAYWWGAEKGYLWADRDLQLWGHKQ